jgi:hypothetical protein
LKLKGKPLNSARATALKMAENESINNILVSVGYRIDESAKTGKSQARVNHIYLLSDPDPDGYHINVLDLIALWKAGDKISAEFSESLSNVSEFDTQFSSNLQLMKNLRVLLLECLKVCHGAYRAKPTQGNSYALTNMVSQIKDITDRLEEAIDYEEVVTQLFDEEMKPFIEKLILSLGTIISNELDLQPNRVLMNVDIDIYDIITKANGIAKTWYGNGQLLEKATYKDGKIDGLFREWYKNGQLCVECTYKNGEYNGLYHSWYDNGQLWEECIHKDGIRIN